MKYQIIYKTAKIKEKAISAYNESFNTEIVLPTWSESCLPLIEN